jgi:transposase
MSGRLVRLIIEVRRFFCKKSTCARKIFAEQLPALCHPHAQRTKRLQEALCRLGLAVGGQAGEDRGCEQGMSGSRDTILRLVRKFELPAAQEPRVIGLDDWAWKRRRHSGTLICDWEQRRPIDLLPDRRVETVSAWLQAHPSIVIVSRDGSSEYASAIKKGAPQARQVSDRWHQGYRTGSQLERELRAQGYKGSQRAMYRYLATLQSSPSKRGPSFATRETAMQPNPLLALSAQQTTWLFFRKQDDLKPEERERLQQLRQASPPIEAAYQLVKKFLQMVRERTGEQLDGWLSEVGASHLEAFDSFATSVRTAIKRRFLPD